jgi:hypothetical protein
MQLLSKLTKLISGIAVDIRFNKYDAILFPRRVFRFKHAEATIHRHSVA